MICLNVLDHADARYGGIANSVPALACAMDLEGRYLSRNVAFCGQSESMPLSWLRLPGNPIAWLADTRAHEQFNIALSKADIVHIHGLWRHHDFTACNRAVHYRKPYVVS